MEKPTARLSRLGLLMGFKSFGMSATRLRPLHKPLLVAICRATGIILPAKLEFQNRTQSKSSALGNPVGERLRDEITVGLLPLGTFNDSLHAFREHLANQNAFKLAGQFRRVALRDRRFGPVCDREPSLVSQQFRVGRGGYRIEIHTSS